MLSGVCVGTNDLKRAGRFYDAVLATLEMRCLYSDSKELGYGGADGKVQLFVNLPYDEQPASFGNGTQVMFYAKDSATVQAFYRTALIYGGLDDGPPGPRDFNPHYYGAYVRDPDGNKLNVSVNPEQSVLA